MFCPNCGATLPDTATYCTNCGNAIPGAGIPVGTGPMPPAPPAAGGYSAEGTAPAAYAPPAGPMRYAGFWLRFVAFIVDWIALQILSLVLTPLLVLLGMDLDPFEGASPAEIFNRPDLFETIWPAALASLVIGWLYYALLESSAWQATPGKKALGLQVTDLDGRRISFARATGRHFAKLLSWFTLAIGFVMAGITRQKQALHDMIADCLVIRRAR